MRTECTENKNSVHLSDRQVEVAAAVGFGNWVYLSSNFDKLPTSRGVLKLSRKSLLFGSERLSGHFDFLL